MDVLLSAWRAGFKQTDQRAIFEWAREAVDLPKACYAVPGPFHVEKSRYLIEPLEALMDDLVREVTVVAGVQTGKSLIGDLFVAHTICRAPAPVMWNFPTNEKANDYAKRRAVPFLRGVRGLPEPEGRHDATRMELVLPTMWLALQAANETNLQSHSVPIVINEEVWQYAPGMRYQAKARTTYFRWRSKVLDISQAGECGDDLDRAFKEGNQCEWVVPCPTCHRFQQLHWFWQRTDGTWGGMRWDDNDQTRPAGKWNYDRLKPTIRYECIHCGAVWRDTPQVRRYLNDMGRYEVTNPNAPREKRSYHWPSMACDEVPWSVLVEEYLQAKGEEEKGDWSLVAQFWKKRLAIAYDAEKHAQAHQFPEVRIERKDGKWWEKQDFIFLKVDVQMLSFWAHVQAWSKDGEDMTLWAGELYGWDDVRAKQLEYEVPDVCVFVDCGEGRSANEVYFQCVRHGHAEGAKWRCWFALRGTAVDGFRFAPDAGPNAKVPRVLPYSWPPTMADPLLGLKSQDELLASVLAWQREYHRKALCPVVNWSAAKVKPIAKARRDALAKGKLSYVAAGVTPDFSKHLYSEQFVQRWDTLGHSKWVWERIGKRPNHLWDCYCMGVVAACMAGIIGERIG